MRKRIERRRPADPAVELPAGLHPVLQRIYAARLKAGEGVDCGLRQLLPTAGLGGLEQAVELLADAVEQGQRILIVGDFDADGATSCALSILALRAMGAAHVDYLVPNRFEYGYGLTPEIVELAAPSRPDLIVTVDNGISSISGVRAAQERGVRVVVTDHHLPGAELPAADAIVNPNLPGDDFPSKCLAGVGVAFYVMAGLRARLREAGYFERRGLQPPNLAEFLDLVALGTVADVVPLDQNNRVLVAQGLQRIQASRCRPGIGALLTVAGRQQRSIAAADLGFAVAPRLNAAGRLEDMSLGIECLLADDPEAARSMAERLDDLNRQRREIEGQMQAEALQLVERLESELTGSELPPALCLMDDGWHQGVIGLLASRIKERFHRPVVAFAPAGDGNELKGSARSVPGLHVRDALERVATRHPELIGRFGGHAMAAGLSLPSEGFDRFREAFLEAVSEELSAEDLEGVLHTDGELQARDFHLELARTLREAGPWGQGFPEPLFDGVFTIQERRLVGSDGRHLKLRLQHPEGGRPLDAICFGAADHGWESCDGHVQLVYRLDVNEYRGRESVQLIVEYMESV